MSIVCTRRMTVIAHPSLPGIDVTTHGHAAEHGRPSVMVTIGGGLHTTHMHLSPDDAMKLAEHLRAAAKASKKSGEVA